MADGLGVVSLMVAAGFAFWAGVVAVAYVYVGYPVLLLVKAKLCPRERPSGPADDFRPGVSIVLAARDEAVRLPARLDNLFALDYPGGRRQVIVVSDGSTDGTLEVLARYPRPIDVVAMPAGGKAAALNAGVARAHFEIIVFADARQTFAPDALLHLTAPFRDASVGAVSGELRLDAEAALFGNRRAAADRRRRRAVPAEDRRARAERRRMLPSTIADGMGLYWRYEKQLRRLESRVGWTLGATGAIYALRRALWQPLLTETILDDVLAPMRAVLAGYRVVFNERALAFDRTSADAGVEVRRKVRTLAGTYQLLALEPRLLRPWRNPVWLPFVSHKLGRLAVPYALLTIYAATLVLAQGSAIYTAALAGQVILFLLAGWGAIAEVAARRRASALGTHRSAEPATSAPEAA